MMSSFKIFTACTAIRRLTYLTNSFLGIPGTIKVGSSFYPVRSVWSNVVDAELQRAQQVIFNAFKPAKNVSFYKHSLSNLSSS